jgi:hypothetical protein
MVMRGFHLYRDKALDSFIQFDSTGRDIWHGLSVGSATAKRWPDLRSFWLRLIYPSRDSLQTTVGRNKPDWWISVVIQPSYVAAVVGANTATVHDERNCEDSRSNYKCDEAWNIPQGHAKRNSCPVLVSMKDIRRLYGSNTTSVENSVNE